MFWGILGYWGVGVMLVFGYFGGIVSCFGCSVWGILGYWGVLGYVSVFGVY